MPLYQINTDLRCDQFRSVVKPSVDHTTPRPVYHTAAYLVRIAAYLVRTAASGPHRTTPRPL